MVPIAMRLIVAVSLLLSACAMRSNNELTASEGANGVSLADTRWTLSAIGEDTVAAATTVTLDFRQDGTVAGNDGCNRYQGTYTNDGRSVEIGGSLMGTLMACPEPVEAQARAYREVLLAAVSFVLDNTGLILIDGAGRHLGSFVPAISSPVGTDWELISYNNGRQGVVSLIIGTEVTASFGDGGRVTGNAGCNEYFAAYEIEGASLSVGPPGVTRRFCADPDGLMEQEALYIEALQSAAVFRLEGANLELRRGDGALAAIFNRRR